MGAVSYSPLSNAEEFVTVSLTHLQGQPFFGFSITLPAPLWRKRIVSFRLPTTALMKFVSSKLK